VLGQQEDAVKVPSADLTVATVPPSPPPPAGEPTLADDPRAWARKRWPLLTAIGATLAVGLVLGIAVHNDTR
jgi:hypothetical protein